MERARRRSRMSTGQSPAPVERRARTSANAASSSSHVSSNEHSPSRGDTPSSSSSAGKYDIAAALGEGSPGDESVRSRTLRRSARLRHQTTPTPPVMDDQASSSGRHQSRSPRRRGSEASSSLRQADLSAQELHHPQQHVAHVVESTIGVALGALGAPGALMGRGQQFDTQPIGHPPPQQLAGMQPMQQPVQQQPMQQQPPPISHAHINFGFPPAPNFTPMQSFSQPNPYPFQQLFAPQFPGGPPAFPPPFYSTMGFGQPFVQDFDWRPMQPMLGAPLLPQQVYQHSMPYPSQLAGPPLHHVPPPVPASSIMASSSSHAGPSTVHPGVSQMPPVYSRAQRIGQAVRTTLQTVRGGDVRGQPDQQLIENLQSSELWRRREAIQTISNLILISDEGANLNISFRDIVNAIKDLLQHEDFNTKSDGVLCLQNLVDVFSRSHGVAADAIPLLIALMSEVREDFGVEVHETALRPLLVLSRKYGRTILHAGGLAGVLRHLYFFNAHAQRSALEVVANAALHVTIQDLDQVGSVIKEIMDNMTNVDSKMCDAACAAFSRIVCCLYVHDSFVKDILDERFELPRKIAQVLRDSVNTKFGATTELLRAVRFLMGCSKDFSIRLHDEGVTNTLSNLLSQANSMRTINSFVDLRELVFLCGELAPALPGSPLFYVDQFIVCGGLSATSSLRGAPEWPSWTCADGRDSHDEIFTILAPPLVSIAASVTNDAVHFEVLRVLIRLLLPCRKMDFFMILSDSECANATMLVSVMRDALDRSSNQVYLKVAAIQLIRTMLEKDMSSFAAVHLKDHGIWDLLELLCAPRYKSKNKTGPITRTRSKALAEAAENRKRSAGDVAVVLTEGASTASDRNADGSPSSKRERDGAGSSRGSRRTHLQSLLGGRTPGEPSTANAPQDMNTPLDLKIRPMTEGERSIVAEWLMQEGGNALRLRSEVTPGDLLLEKLARECQTQLLSDPGHGIPLRFYSEFMRLMGQQFTSDQVLKSELHFLVLGQVISGNASDAAMPLVQSLQSMLPHERRNKFGHAIRALAGCVDLSESFNVHVFDLASYAAPHLFHGAGALRYFRNHVVTINVSRHPKCAESGEPPSQPQSFKTDPLVSMRHIYSVVRNRLPVRQASSSDDDDDFPNAPFHFPDIELLTPNGLVIDESRVLLEVLLTMSVSVDQVLTNVHHLHYRTKKNTGPARTGREKINIEALLRQELSNEPKEFVLGKTMTGAPLIPNAAEANKVFTSTMIQQIYRTGTAILTSMGLSAENAAAKQLRNSLNLLTFFFYVNQYWHYCFPNGILEKPFAIVPKDDFICKKLDAKVNRQIGDFLTIASQGLPGWVAAVALHVPFVLSFETRRSFFLLSAFGRERALSHWLQARDVASEDSQYMRVKKMTVEVHRDNFLHFAYAALSDTPSGTTLEVKFRGEAGTGHGPTQEFYSILSRELKRSSLNLWYPSRVETDPETNEKLVASDYGLFPLPCTKEQRLEKIRLYELLGRALGQSLQDGKRLDIVLNPIVMKYLIGKPHLIGPTDIAMIDPVIYASMCEIERSSPEDLDAITADFVVPNVDMKIAQSPAESIVNEANRFTYIKRFRQTMLLTVREPLEAIAHGIDAVFPRDQLQCFLPDEFEPLFCGAGGADSEAWIPERMLDALKFDLGYSRESATIKNLVRMLVEFSPAKRQRFLQFVTGSPRLPHGGFSALSPPLTVVCKSTTAPDCEFPSAVTCKNYVKLPNYSSYEVMIRQFEVALTNALHFDYN